MRSLLLALTVAVEAALACASPARRDVVPAALALNLISHPIAVAAMLQGASFWLVELAVILAEFAGYRLLARVSWRHALGLSALCNGATIALSLAIFS